MRRRMQGRAGYLYLWCINELPTPPGVADPVPGLQEPKKIMRLLLTARYGIRRSYSSSSSVPAQIYESTSLDPHFNLALEDWFVSLFKQAAMISSIRLIILMWET